MLIVGGLGLIVTRCCRCRGCVQHSSGDLLLLLLVLLGDLCNIIQLWLVLYHLISFCCVCDIHDFCLWLCMPEWPPAFAVRA
jgi:hypothetical protein